MIIEFDRKILEDKFQEAEKILQNKRNVSIIHYENFDHEKFDNYNQDFLSEIAQKPIVYYMWTGKTAGSLEPNLILTNQNYI